MQRKELANLQAAIYEGLTDLDEGRGHDVEAARIIERGRKLLATATDKVWPYPFYTSVWRDRGFGIARCAAAEVSTGHHRRYPLYRLKDIYEKPTIA